MQVAVAGGNSGKVDRLQEGKITCRTVFHHMVAAIRDNVPDYEARVIIFGKIITLLDSERLMCTRFLLKEDPAFDEAYKKVKSK